MLSELDGGDWGEVFKYADKPDECPPGSSVSCTSFTREDVETVFASEDGENDGDPWRMVGKLKDGRYFYIEASCDYTGWG